MSQVSYLSQMTLAYFGVISQGKMHTDISHRRRARLASRRLEVSWPKLPWYVGQSRGPSTYLQAWSGSTVVANTLLAHVWTVHSSGLAVSRNSHGPSRNKPTPPRTRTSSGMQLDSAGQDQLASWMLPPPRSGRVPR